MLVNAYLQDYLKANPITDDMMKKEYETAKAQTGGKEYKARHILVKSEDEAKQIIAQLKKGASFEKLAAEKSEDTGSKGKGGDLDWSPPNRYVKPFSDALMKLKKGQMTDTPVQSPFGWHVIRLDDERPFKVPGFDKAKANIHQQLQNQAVQKQSPICAPSQDRISFRSLTARRWSGISRASGGHCEKCSHGPSSAQFLGCHEF